MGIIDQELRDYLEQRFSRMEAEIGSLRTEVGGLGERLGRVEAEVGGLRAEVGTLRAESARLGVLLDSVNEQVRMVAEGHSILYGAIDRQYEEVRAELRDVRGLLKLWNDLVTRRLGDLEFRIREKVGPF